MRERVLEPVGVELIGVSLPNLDDTDIPRLRELLATHGVIVFRDQQVDDVDFLTFLKRFGQLAFTVGETPVDGFGDLNLITNVGRSTPPSSTFHIDTSYVRTPPAYTALRAVQVPAAGGQTLFTNQYRAYDTLPDEVRVALAGRTIRHVVTGLDLGPDDETQADHPAFRPHPRSGRTAVYVSTPQRCVAVSGMDEAEARAAVAALIAHSTRPENIYSHRWLPGDVVMWDNGCVMHKADHSGVLGDRVMHRGMVAGYGT